MTNILPLHLSGRANSRYVTPCCYGLAFILAATAPGAIIRASSHSTQGLCLVDEADARSAHRYFLAFSNALGVIEALPSTSTNSSPTDDLVRLRHNKSAYLCAASHLEPYLASDVLPIATSAKGATQAFKAMAGLQDDLFDRIKEIMNARDPASLGAGNVAAAAADIRVEADELTQSVLLAALAASYAAAEQNPSTGLMSGLSMTATQRDEVLKSLRSNLGLGVTQGLRAGQSRIVAAGTLIYKVVSDPNRKPRSQ